MRPNRRQNIAPFLSSGYLLLGLAVAGCGGGNPVQSIQNTIQQTVNDAQAAVAETVAQGTGKISITLPKPIELASAYAWVIPAGENRPAVLQIASYLEEEMAKLKPPFVFFQADLPEGKIEELVGKKVPGRLFVQVEDDYLFASSWDVPVEFEITSANSWSVGCKAAELPLLAPGDPTEVKVNCELIGVLQAMAGTGVAPTTKPTEGSAPAAPAANATPPAAS